MRGFATSFAIAGFILTGGAAISVGEPHSQTELKSAASFANIADENARAVALFTEAGKVIQHPRCLNRVIPRATALRRAMTATRISRSSCEVLMVLVPLRCVAQPAMANQTSIPAAYQAIPTGILPRSRWLGSANRLPRSACRLRTMSAMAA